MGLIVFVIASGLTLIFGLMDVLNFGHGVFIALGAFVATSVMGGMADWSTADSAGAQPGGGVRRHAGGDGVPPARSAWPSSASIVRPVYGQHLKQILITMGGMIVGEELIKVIWGPQQIALPLPDDAARPLRHRRCVDREVPRAGGGHRAWWCSRCCCSR